MVGWWGIWVLSRLPLSFIRFSCIITAATLPEIILNREWGGAMTSNES